MSFEMKHAKKIFCQNAFWMHFLQINNMYCCGIYYKTTVEKLLWRWVRPLPAIFKFFWGSTRDKFIFLVRLTTPALFQLNNIWRRHETHCLINKYFNNAIIKYNVNAGLAPHCLT